MKYYYKNLAGNEVGPFENDAFIQLIKAGEILPATPVRNSMLTYYSEAAAHQALKKYLIEAELQRAGNSNQTAEVNASKSSAAKFGQISTVARLVNNQIMDIETVLSERSNVFVREHKAGDAPFSLRFAAGLTELALWMLILLFCVLTAIKAEWNNGEVFIWNSYSQSFVRPDYKIQHGGVWNLFSFTKTEKSADKPVDNSLTNRNRQISPHPAAERELETSKIKSQVENMTDYKFYFPQDVRLSPDDTKLEIRSYPHQTITWLDYNQVKKNISAGFMIWLGLLIVYNVFCFGYFAQNISMWFWGLMIVRDKSSGKIFSDVNYIIALRYAFAMLFTGWLLPATYAATTRRGVHCIISGTRVSTVGSKG